MGSQRIASNLISEAFDHNDPNLVPIEGPEGKYGYTNPQSAIVQDIFATLECLSGEELTINYGDMLYLPSIGDPIIFTDDEQAEFEDPNEIPAWLACEQSLYWSGQGGVDCSEIEVMYWYHPDYLGSVEFVTDMKGEAYQFFLNTPWGENIENQFARNYTAFSSRFRFNGKEWDEETGNFYYGARYYDPKISVWVSVDPLASNYPYESPYNFVENNPLKLVDPTGLGPEEASEQYKSNGKLGFDWLRILPWYWGARGKERLRCKRGAAGRRAPKFRSWSPKVVIISKSRVKKGRWQTVSGSGETWNQTVTLSVRKNPGDQVEVNLTTFNVPDQLTVSDQNGQSFNTGQVSVNDQTYPVPDTYSGQITATVTPSQTGSSTKYIVNLRRRSRTTVTTEWKLLWGFIPIGISFCSDAYESGDENRKLSKREIELGK